MQDRYIRQFSSAWHGINTETGGVEGDYIPEAYAQECINLAKGLTKHPITGHWVKEAVTMAVPGTSITVSRDENDTMVIRDGNGTVQVPGTALAQFLRVVLSIPQGVDMPETGIANPGQSSSAAVWDSNARQDERVEAAHKQIEATKEWQRQRAIVEGHIAR